MIVLRFIHRLNIRSRHLTCSEAKWRDLFPFAQNQQTSRLHFVPVEVTVTASNLEIPPLQFVTIGITAEIYLPCESLGINIFF